MASSSGDGNSCWEVTPRSITGGLKCTGWKWSQFNNSCSFRTETDDYCGSIFAGSATWYEFSDCESLCLEETRGLVSSLSHSAQPLIYLFFVKLMNIFRCSYCARFRFAYPGHQQVMTSRLLTMCARCFYFDLYNCWKAVNGCQWIPNLVALDFEGMAASCK